jgi:hypothetical protein
MRGERLACRLADCGLQLVNAAARKSRRSRTDSGEPFDLSYDREMQKVGQCGIVTTMAHTKSRVPRRIAKGYVIGRERFAKISAVEGIHVTAEMDDDFRRFDRQALSASERRRLISKKYAKKS